MKKLRNVAMALFFILAILIIGVCTLYNYNLSPVDKKDSEKIEILIPSGSSTKQIGDILEEKGVIHNANFFLLYCKLYNIKDIKANSYLLSKDMPLEDIVKTIRDDKEGFNPDEIKITFREGITIPKIASIIKENTNNSYDDVINTMKDSAYLDELIKDYWFITEDIKNPEIYYSLEGYLYPNTYIFANKDVTVKEIFKKMLDESDRILSKYRSDIESSQFNIHEILTLSSMVEQEAVSQADRNDVASVFYNRLKSNWSLGSDVTTYYGLKLEMGKDKVPDGQWNVENAYNTRAPSMAGKLPVGPISNVSESSLKAVLYPIESENYYFLADIYQNVYCMETAEEHQSKKNELIAKGEWPE